MNGEPLNNELVGILPLAIVMIPFIGAALATPLGRLSEKYRDYLTLTVTALTCILSALLFFYSWQGVVTAKFNIGFGELPLYFRVDQLGAVFNLLSSFIWFLATVFSLSYMTHEKRRNRYYTFYLLTLGGCLGVFLTADLFSLFFFFELMSVASYLLVVHNQSEEAISAGRLYIFLGIFGGLCLLTATILLYWYTGSVLIEPRLEELIMVPARILILVLLIIGFGIKAGMVPLHIWLPKAHPVAPAPASALLSGIMIKTGAYGIIRVLTVIYTPSGEEAKTLWAFTEQIGYVMIWFGITTMFVAAVMALFQLNAKRILAYSSVSQMGYILMGVGVCAYLGLDGAVAFGGFSFHIVNHAFFKAGMFMMVGAVFFRTGE
ncbi:MAG: monovalent cation/H+ antiporter subunit D family protein [Firmicutes bacterium]|nr:monovalent cation/H+ antiporter subunit D family protein [Bacillota bacterium]